MGIGFATITRLNFLNPKPWKLHTAHFSRPTSYIKTKGSVSPWKHTKTTGVHFTVLEDTITRFIFHSRKPLKFHQIHQDPLPYDATLPSRAPMFRVRRPLFATSSMTSCSTVCVSIAYVAWGGLFISLKFPVYLPDIYDSHFTLSIVQNASLHLLFHMGESDYQNDNMHGEE